MSAGASQAGSPDHPNPMEPIVDTHPYPNLVVRRLAAGLATLAALTAAGTPALAQGTDPLQVATARRLPPPLMVVASDEGPTRHVGVTRVAVQAHVVGHLAETRMTLTFGNTHGRALAGDLYVPLPPDATVSGYALDVGGQMIDGVVVPKEEARRIFEAEVRKGVDPGLVEWTRGNVFKTRVFPIPANGSRTVSLTWVAPLEQRGNEAVYHLPLSFENKLSEASVRVEVLPGSGKPRIETGPGLKLAFDTRQVAETTLRDRAVVEDVRIIVPTTLGAALAEKSELAGHGEGVWVSLRDMAAPPADLSKKLLPKRISVLWDASLSRGKADHAREIRLLTKWLDTLGAAEVELTIFRNAAETPVRFALPGQLGALEKALSSVLYDGGTQLGSISPAPGPIWADAVVVFTDGISTIGRETVEKLGAPAWFVNSAQVSAPAGLEALAAENGGAYLDLARVDDAKALAALGRPAWTLLGVEVVSGHIEQLLPNRPTPALGPIQVTGRMVSKDAEVKLRWGFAGRAAVVERTHRIALPDAVPSGETLRFAWAQAQMATLMKAPERHAEELVALGRAHRIVTPGTSLLVLETLEQYLTYGVEPPATWKEMHAAWHAGMKQRLEIAAADDKTRLDEVATAWAAELAWYKTEFKPFFKKEAVEQKKGIRNGLGFSGEGSGGGGVGHGRMAAPPRAVTAAEPAPEREESAADEAPKMAENKDKGGRDAGPAADITIAEWNPDVPWLKVMKAATGDVDAAYVAQREKHGAAPSFYLDVAEFFFARKDLRRGLRVLSNLAELRLDEPALLRVMGHRLAQLNELDLAVMVFEQVKRLRPEEPQSFRDLGLVLGRRALELKTVAGDLDAALELLAQVIKRRWDRFEGIEIITLYEFNRLVSLGTATKKALPLDARFVHATPLDLRISMSWDADMTDMDIHVIEPSGEEAYYSYNLTEIGGRVSRDFTQGYGPETYSIRKAMKGTYKVRTKYFGSRAAALTGGVTLQVDLVTNWGRPNETRRSLSLRLTESKEEFVVGEIAF